MIYTKLKKNQKAKLSVKVSKEKPPNRKARRAHYFKNFRWMGHAWVGIKLADSKGLNRHMRRAIAVMPDRPTTIPNPQEFRDLFPEPATKFVPNPFFDEDAKIQAMVRRNLKGERYRLNAEKTAKGIKDARKRTTSREVSKFFKEIVWKILINHSTWTAAPVD